MYRRRQPRIQKSEEIKHVEKKEERKEEPVIKAVVKPQRNTTYTEACPMVNILRDIKYFGEQDATGSEHYYVPFNTMVDIALSQGYLNVRDTTYYKDGEWNGAYEDTTNWKRNTLMSGDIIYTHDDHTSFAFLISKVYKDSSASDASSELDMNPPVDQAKDNSEEQQYLSSFVTCNGTVYMFKKDAKFVDIKNYVSQYTNNEEYRKLVPSNVSEYVAANSDNSFSSCKTADNVKPDGYPKNMDDLPTQLGNGDSADQFNFLSGGVVVEGWLIYMKSTVNSETAGAVQDTKNIIGDIIRTGPTIISVISKKTLSIGSTYNMPFILAGSYDASTSPKMSYNGNSTKFASEPLNSEHYQQNYGDTQSLKQIAVKETTIHSLTKIIDIVTEENSNVPDPGN